LINERDKHQKNAEIALISLEQFYPMPVTELRDVLKQYSNAELIWVQEEPENQGAWYYLDQQFAKHLPDYQIRAISRPASASPAAGSTKRHAIEQVDLIERIFAQK